MQFFIATAVLCVLGLAFTRLTYDNKVFTYISNVGFVASWLPLIFKNTSWANSTNYDFMAVIYALAICIYTIHINDIIHSQELIKKLRTNKRSKDSSWFINMFRDIGIIVAYIFVVVDESSNKFMNLNNVKIVRVNFSNSKGHHKVGKRKPKILHNSFIRIIICILYLIFIWYAIKLLCPILKDMRV